MLDKLAKLEAFPTIINPHNLPWLGLAHFFFLTYINPILSSIDKLNLSQDAP